MNEKSHPKRSTTVTRRQAIAGIALAVGGLAAGTRARGDTQDSAKPSQEEAPGKPRASLHYEADFKVGPGRIYGVLLDPTQFAAMTGRPAVINATEGGAFSLFGGLILGRNVELLPT